MSDPTNTRRSTVAFSISVPADLAEKIDVRVLEERLNRSIYFTRLADKDIKDSEKQKTDNQH